MFSWILTLLLVSLAITANAGDIEKLRYDTEKIRGDHLQDKFMALNFQLHQEVFSNDHTKNFDAAKEMFDQLIASGVQVHSSQWYPNGDALILFQALSTVGQPDRVCNLKSLEILSKNYEAANLNSDDPKKIPDRIGKIVFQICENHAKKCQHVYPEKVRQKYTANMKKTDLAIVESLFNAFYSTWAQARAGKDVSVYDFVNDEDLKDFVVANSHIFFQQLVAHSKDEAGHRFIYPVRDPRTGALFLERRDVTNALTDKYLFSPCWSYVYKYDDVFQPAAFDAAFVKVDRSEAAFYDAFARYKICNLVSRKWLEIKQALEAYHRRNL